MSQATLRLLFGALVPKEIPPRGTRYRRVGGFLDNTDFLEAIEGEIWLQLKSGWRRKMQPTVYDPATCERYVQDGIWGYV